MSTTASNIFRTLNTKDLTLSKSDLRERHYLPRALNMWFYGNLIVMYELCKFFMIIADNGISKSALILYEKVIIRFPYIYWTWDQDRGNDNWYAI